MSFQQREMDALRSIKLDHLVVNHETWKVTSVNIRKHNIQKYMISDLG
jgi:hypothetical protein